MKMCLLHCDQMAIFFSIFGHYHHYYRHNDFAKVGSKFCQTLFEPSTNLKRFIKICQSRFKILPNLIELAFSDLFCSPSFGRFQCDQMMK